MRSTIARRHFLRATAGTLAITAVAGCSSDGSSGEYSVTIGDGDTVALSPIESGRSHPEFYHGGDATETSDATHGYTEAQTATMFVHRSTADGAGDGLVLTYDSSESDDGGRARVEFDESITPSEDLLVADGPFGREGADTGDTYAEDHFVHQWGNCCTDGVVVSLAAFSEPTFEFGDTENLEAVRVLSAADGENLEETARGGIDESVAVEF